MEYFEQAIERDPSYALAYAGVALACTELAEAGALRPDEAYARAKRAVAKALELDSDLGDAHYLLALLKYLCDFDWTGAEQEFKRALELNPSSADTYDYYGRMLSALERYDEAIAMVKRAQELDPLAHPLDVASALLRAGRYDEALRAATPAIELDPHYARGHATLGWAYLKKGMSDEGLAELEKAVALSPGHSIWLGQLGQAYALVGKVGQAREVLRQLEELSRQRYVSPYHMAYVYAGLGEQDSAMDWLERAYVERAGAVYGVKGSFLFTVLRSHPRFTALLKKMNLA
jgi:tetratricopeptide (TPR) repeat protein